MAGLAPSPLAAGGKPPSASSPAPLRAWLPWLVLLATPVLTWLALSGLPFTLVYNTVTVLAPGGLRLEVHPPGVASSADCLALGERVAAPIRASAGAGALTVSSACRPGFAGAGEDLRLLGSAPIPVASARTADGTVLTYQAQDPAVAQAVCMQAATASRQGGPARQFSCFAAGSRRVPGP